MAAQVSGPAVGEVRVVGDMHIRKVCRAVLYCALMQRVVLFKINALPATIPACGLVAEGEQATVAGWQLSDACSQPVSVYVCRR